jgi:hypothetical protein
MARDQQATPEFPATREAAEKLARNVKARSARRAAKAKPLIDRFCKRDRVTCVTPTGPMRARRLLKEIGPAVRGGVAPRVKGAR